MLSGITVRVSSVVSVCVCVCVCVSVCVCVCARAILLVGWLPLSSHWLTRLGSHELSLAYPNNTNCPQF